MQIVSNADNLHEMSNMFNGKIRKKNILKCRLLEILPRVLSVKKDNNNNNNNNNSKTTTKKQQQQKTKNIFLTENNYFALHSDIPYVLEKNVL